MNHHAIHVFLFLAYVLPSGSIFPPSSTSGFLDLVTKRSSGICSWSDLPASFAAPAAKWKEANASATVSSEIIEPPIATFDEWSKERLKLKPRALNLDLGAQSANGHSRLPGEDAAGKFREARISSASTPDTHPQRNYASKECGAKVLYSNPEMQNRGAVLNDKERDQYLRNPCVAATNKFLIVELCETIQVTRVQLANFELFSSGPQDFRISVAERSPTAEWLTIGEFKAGDNRELQTFAVSNNRVYSKFIRIELLTHYGSEHYCTLSVLRTYGISMVDEYEAEAAALGSVTETVMKKAPEISEAAKQATKPVVRETEKTDIENSSDNIVNKVVVGTIGGLKSAIKTAFSWHGFGAEKVQNTSKPKLLERCWTCTSKRPKESLWMCYVFANYISSGAQRSGHSMRSLTFESAQSQFLKIVTFSRQCKADTVAARIPSVKNVSPSAPPARMIFVPNEHDGPLPASSTNHKESVFLKLNKRITSLELNMSLSSEYLSELSRRYVQQTEDMKKQQDRVLRSSEEAAVKVVQGVREALLSEIKQLRVQMAALTKNLEILRDAATTTTAEVARRTPKEHQEENDAEDGCDIDDENAECATLTSEPPLGYFQVPDHLWTTSQLVCILVVLQAFSLFVFYSFNGVRSTKNDDEIARIRQLEEKLAELTQQSPDLPEAEEAIAPTGLSANQRKRLRKKLKQQQKKHEEWDNSSSLAASTTTGTRCPSDHSGDEIENVDSGGWNVVRKHKKG
ncbi:hypothetical protein QR680_017468 [Steinernema hermaphroditum]|uniref:SUN domain-containing protein n=1 Tax=Steinernema hermaphroditum TaxID=289476 RepID=A0AA39HFA0_9BILA|nr:hypothetical protein QR680_017468 [Steinernema hermaphroditum]